MCDDAIVVHSEDDSNSQLQHSVQTDKVELIIGSYDMVAEGLSIRRMEDDGFDAMGLLDRASAIIPEAATIADAINQYGYALLKSPKERASATSSPERRPDSKGTSSPQYITRMEALEAATPP